MAQTNAPVLSPEAGGQKKGTNIKPVIIGVVVLAVAGAGAFFLLKGKGEHSEKKEKKEKVSLEALEILSLPAITANLADADTFRAIKVKINLGTGDKSLTGKFQKDVFTQSVVQDTVIRIISTKLSSELLTEKGKESLKKEIKESLNKKLEDEPIEEVFFTDFIIQM